jgi:hypothetical protein
MASLLLSRFFCSDDLPGDVVVPLLLLLLLEPTAMAMVVVHTAGSAAADLPSSRIFPCPG